MYHLNYDLSERWHWPDFGSLCHICHVKLKIRLLFCLNSHQYRTNIHKRSKFKKIRVDLMKRTLKKNEFGLQSTPAKNGKEETQVLWLGRAFSSNATRCLGCRKYKSIGVEQLHTWSQYATILKNKKPHFEFSLNRNEIWHNRCSLYVVHSFHYIYLAMQAFCLPIERSNVSLFSTDQQMSTISCVIYSIWTKLVQTQIEILLRWEQVDILDYVLLSYALVFVLFFQVTEIKTLEIVINNLLQLNKS